MTSAVQEAADRYLEEIDRQLMVIRFYEALEERAGTAGLDDVGRCMMTYSLMERTKASYQDHAERWATVHSAIRGLRRAAPGEHKGFQDDVDGGG
jgi:hypothetical protein